MAVDDGGGWSPGFKKLGSLLGGHVFRGTDGDMPHYNPDAGEEEDKEEKKKHALGVPDDYRARVQRPYYEGGLYEHPSAAARATAGRVATYTTGPKYFDGDEWKPANLSGGSIASIQRALVTAGLLPGGFQNFGVWDDSTAKAYSQVLTHANAKGISDQMALSDLYQRGLAGARSDSGSNFTEGGGPGIIGYDPEGNPIFEQYQAPPLEVTTTNKKDLAHLFRKGVVELLGQGWSREQIRELVDAYNWQEIKVQKDAYDQQIENERRAWEGGGEAPEMIEKVSVQDPQSFLEEEAERRDPEGFAATEISEDFAPAFFEALGGYV